MILSWNAYIFVITKFMLSISIKNLLLYFAPIEDSYFGCLKKIILILVLILFKSKTLNTLHLKHTRYKYFKHVYQNYKPKEILSRNLDYFQFFFFFIYSRICLIICLNVFSKNLSNYSSKLLWEEKAIIL